MDAILFDLGKVLLDWSPRYYYERFFAGDERALEGFLEEVALPRNPLALMQVIEYLRSFLFGRMGWEPLGATRGESEGIRFGRRHRWHPRALSSVRRARFGHRA